MEAGSDQHPGDAYVYALRDEEAYLQTDEDEKPGIIAEPPPDTAWFKCAFCRRTDRRVLFGAEYPVRDPTTFAVIALIFICDKCVANFAESLGRSARRLHRRSRSPADIGLTVPGRRGGPWSRRTGAPQVSATRRDQSLRGAVVLVRAGSARHREPPVLAGHERSRPVWTTTARSALAARSTADEVRRRRVRIPPPPPSRDNDRGSLGTRRWIGLSRQIAADLLPEAGDSGTVGGGEGI